MLFNFLIMLWEGIKKIIWAINYICIYQNFDKISNHEKCFHIIK